MLTHETTIGADNGCSRNRRAAEHHVGKIILNLVANIRVQENEMLMTAHWAAKAASHLLDPFGEAVNNDLLLLFG